MRTGTVDPARDTPPRLASYLENFDKRITCLTGRDAQTAAAAKAYRVYYSPIELEKSGADIVGHSTFVYLMNPSGRKRQADRMGRRNARDSTT